MNRGDVAKGAACMNPAAVPNPCCCMKDGGMGGTGMVGGLGLGAGTLGTRDCSSASLSRTRLCFGGGRSTTGEALFSESLELSLALPYLAAMLLTKDVKFLGDETGCALWAPSRKCECATPLTTLRSPKRSGLCLVSGAPADPGRLGTMRGAGETDLV
jgi:hypothetical protein